MSRSCLHGLGTGPPVPFPLRWLLSRLRFSVTTEATGVWVVPPRGLREEQAALQVRCSCRGQAVSEAVPEPRFVSFRGAPHQN